MYAGIKIYRYINDRWLDISETDPIATFTYPFAYNLPSSGRKDGQSYRRIHISRQPDHCLIFAEISGRNILPVLPFHTSGIPTGCIAGFLPLFLHGKTVAENLSFLTSVTLGIVA